MAPKGDDPAGGTICVNSGWGSTSHSSAAQMPNKLQFVEMPIVSRPDCQEDYSGVNGVDEGMICAGIVSWGMIPCGQANRPSVFTSVGFFRDWIDEHLALQELEHTEIMTTRTTLNFFNVSQKNTTCPFPG